MIKLNFFRYSVILLVLLFSACSKHQLTTMHLKKEEYLLKKNQVRVTGGKDINKNDLALYIRQKPNQSWLFGTWKIGLQWKNIWYREKKGKPRAAVILDSSSVDRSMKQMKIYLQNQGYYNSEVSSNIRITRILGVKKWETKKAIVEYHVNTGSAYFIDSTGINIPDSVLNTLYQKTKNDSYIKSGSQLKIESLQRERERIAKSYQNQGFFDFTENFVHYDIDTNQGVDHSAVITKIKLPNSEENSHIQYKIRNIYIQTDFDAYNDSVGVLDTTLFRDNVYFISKGKSKFSPHPIFRCIFLKSKELYSLSLYNSTYKQLLNLQMFSLIDVDFTKIKEGGNPKQQELDVHISLTPARKMSISAEGMATFREGFGTNGQLAFSSKNPFRGSEIFEFRIAGGFENLKSSTGDGQILGGNFGPRLSIKFPSFLFFPKLNAGLAKNAFPSSTISGVYNYQRRVDFTRYLANFYLKYEWNEGKYKKHELNVLDFSFSYIAKNSKILSSLSELTPSEKFRFEDNISSGIKYRFTYNNQNNLRVKHPVYFIAKGSLIGFSSIISKAFSLEKRDVNNAINLFGLRYSNYFNIDLDYRFYYHFNKEHIVVFRAFSGAALTMDKYSVIPFEQLYFAGGANSVRAWQQRTLGPGVYYDDDNFYDRLGEVKIEGNIEYRFPITSVLKGAAFIDIGNVWTLNNENSEANFNELLFYKQLAISPGLGLRLDFDFFLFRVDAAVPFKQPHLSGITKLSSMKPNWNFGIGYPF